MNKSSVSDAAVQWRSKRLSPGENVVLWSSRLIIWVIIILTMIPLLFVASAAFNPGNAYFSSSLIPAHPSWANFVKLFVKSNSQADDGMFLVWARNSVIVALTVGIGQVFFTATAAFAFSRLRFYGRKHGLVALLILQMFPNTLALVAIYVGFAKLNMIDNVYAYALALLGGSAYNIFLLKGYMDALPRDLDEAAIIDGANTWQRFWNILLPLVVPMLVVIFIFSIQGSISEYMLAGTVIQTPDKFTLALGLNSLIQQQFAKNWGEFAAGALLAAAPLTIIFAITQRWIASGLAAGSVKG